jgi:hypothetical protein
VVVKDDRVVVHRRDHVEVLGVPGRVAASISAATRARGERPEVILHLGRGLLAVGSEDRHLGLAVGVVVEAAERVAGNLHRRLRARVKDVVDDLACDHSSPDDVDLLLARVAMAVAAAAAGPGQHPAPVEGDLLARGRSHGTRRWLHQTVGARPIPTDRTPAHPFTSSMFWLQPVVGVGP